MQQQKRKYSNSALDLSSPTDIVAGLPLSHWKLLLFSSLSLTDLVALRRTCKALACYEALKELVSERESAEFGTIDRRYWNKMEECNKFGTFPLRTDQFYCYQYKANRLLFGVFSSRRLLFKEFEKDVKHVNPFRLKPQRGLGLEKTRFIVVSGGIRVLWHKNSPLRMLVSRDIYNGLTEEYMREIASTQFSIGTKIYMVVRADYGSYKRPLHFSYK